MINIFNSAYIIGAMYSFFAGSLLFLVIYIFKIYGFSLKIYLLTAPIVLTHQFIFNYIYSSVYPNVSKGWIITTVVVSSVIFIFSFLFFKEEITYKLILALLFISMGVYFLR